MIGLGALGRQPIARKLAWMITGASALVLILMSMAVWTHEIFRFRNAKQAEWIAVADVLSANTKAALLFGDRARATETLHALRATPAVLRAEVLDTSGNWFAGYERPKMAGEGNRKQRGEWFQLRVERDIRVDGQAIGTIVLAGEIDEILSAAKSYLLAIAAIAAAILGLVSLITSRLQRFVSEPLLNLASAARRLSERDYSVRAVKQSDDEIGDLTDAFNHMVEEVSRQTQSLLALNEQLADARAKADEAARMKAEFLANMSHEIRTPMNGIIGMTELMLETQLNTEQSEYLKTVSNSADSLLALLNSILDFSKIEAGKMLIEQSDFELPALLEDLHRLFAVAAHQKGIELVWSIDPAIPAWVNGDTTRLRQVLTNLIGNAVKFTQNGEVVTTVKLLPGEDAELRLQFEVHDTGIGISAEQKRRIFEAFVQADGSTTRHYGGTGLGLAISRSLVGLMGGELEVDSSAGEGSAFRFAIRAGRCRLEAEAGGTDELRNRRALIVDDNEANRRILKEHLRHAGMRTTVAGSGSEALRILSGQGDDSTFDLILTDVQMPEMDGFEFAALAKRENLARSAVIMMITSVDVMESVARCRELGVTQYIVKPVSKRALLRHVRNALLLPSLAEPVDTPSPVAAAAVPHVSGLKILVAEDNAVNQRLVMRLLEKDSHQPLLARNGVEAVAAYRAGRFDVVLMDVQMPELDGIGATGQIRAWELETGGSHTPIIALTAHALAGDQQRCMDAGMDSYLSKPLKADDLRTAIAMAVTGPVVQAESPAPRL